MKRVKPGRGPSMMGAASSIFAAVFGIFWTILALSMDAPWFFPAFGIMFIILAVVQGLFHYKNATGKERFSVFDIVDDEEEGDPLDPLDRSRDTARSGSEAGSDDTEVNPWGEARSDDTEVNPWGEARSDDTEVNFCPYCGAKVEKGFRFCQKCGKRIR